MRAGLLLLIVLLVCEVYLACPSDGLGCAEGSVEVKEYDDAEPIDTTGVSVSVAVTDSVTVVVLDTLDERSLTVYEHL